MQTWKNATMFLEYGTTNLPQNIYHTRQGFLVSTENRAGTDVSYVGHLFGRLGEGIGNYPGEASPFYWGAPNKNFKPSI